MEIATFGSIGITVALSVLGAEVIKKKLMDWIFPPAKPVFGETERTMLSDMKNRLNALPEECPTLTAQEHKALMDLLELHSSKDSDGVPLHLVPRSFKTAQDETLKVTQEMTFAQKETARAIENMARVIERLMDRVEDLRRRD